MAPFVGPSRFGLSPLEAALGGTYTKADLHIDLTSAGDDVLGEIEALEVAKARLESELLDAYAVLHTVEAEQIAAASVHVSTDRVVTDEIALATGVGAGEVARRLNLATAPRRHRLVLEALRDGELSLHRALQVASETALLPDVDVAAVAAAVLAPSRDGQRVPQRTFVTRLRRSIASLDHQSAAERRGRARSRHGVFGRQTEDGMGCLTLVASGDVVAAILDRLDAAARARRSAGDPRSLDQLRCDLAAEVLLRGDLGRSTSCGWSAFGGASSSGGSGGPGNSSGRGGPGNPGKAGNPGSGGSAVGRGNDVGSPGSGGPGNPGGEEAPGSVWLIVPFEVATGASDAACELPGHGWVTAEHAREIMTRDGSVWRTLPVDIRTGRALSRPTAAYRPTRQMVEHVRAVDGVCRGPGCEVVAARCDLDHEAPWPTGPTEVDNLHAKDRFHHNVKTAGVWTSRPVADDGLEWSTVAGRRYVTYPKDWREGLRGGPPDRAPTRPPAPADPGPPPF